MNTFTGVRTKERSVERGGGSPDKLGSMLLFNVRNVPVVAAFIGAEGSVGQNTFTSLISIARLALVVILKPSCRNGFRVSQRSNGLALTTQPSWFKTDGIAEGVEYKRATQATIGRML